MIMMDAIEVLKIDVTHVKDKIVKGLREYTGKHGLKKGVIGISGGIDSAVALFISSNALEPENITALIMPSRFTKKEDINDAIDVCRRAGVRFKIIDISLIEEAFQKTVSIKSRISIGNRQARIRMVLLYSVANDLGGFVIGTGNKSELLTGYFTKYGDGGVDILPIGGLYKTQVRMLAKAFPIPPTIIEKKPSAGLWPGQTDEGELGLSYETLDLILYFLYDMGRNPGDVKNILGLDKEVDRVVELLSKSGHKWEPPPIIDPF